MEAARNVAEESPPTLDNVIAEARRLRKLCERLDGPAVVEYSRAVVDLARASAVRIEQLAERIARAAACTDERHEALKRGPRVAFEAAVELDGTLDGVRPIGACKRCHSSLVYVGGGA